MKYLGDGFWIDDDVHAVSEQYVDEEKYWFFPFAEVESSERIGYGYAASKKRYPQEPKDVQQQVNAPGSPMVLAEPFNTLVTDGVEIDEIVNDIVTSGGSPPVYIEDIVWGWIGYKSDYAELAKAYGLDPDDYDGPGVYDLRDLTKGHKTVDAFEVASAEFWAEETIDYLAQSSEEEDDETRAKLLDELGGDPEMLDKKPEPAKPEKPKRRKGRGFEFLN